MTILQQIAELAAHEARRQFFDLRLKGQDHAAGGVQEIVMPAQELGRLGDDLLAAAAHAEAPTVWASVPAEVHVLIKILGSQVDKGARV